MGIYLILEEEIKLNICHKPHKSKSSKKKNSDKKQSFVDHEAYFLLLGIGNTCLGNIFPLELFFFISRAYLFSWESVITVFFGNMFLIKYDILRRITSGI